VWGGGKISVAYQEESNFCTGIYMTQKEFFGGGILQGGCTVGEKVKVVTHHWKKLWGRKFARIHSKEIPHREESERKKLGESKGKEVSVSKRQKGDVKKGIGQFLGFSRCKTFY